MTTAAARPAAEVLPQEDAVVRAACAGNQRAFNSLVQIYQRRLYNYTYRMVGNADDACDITQEAFVRAWRNIASFRVGEPIAPWLYRIAHNLCIDHLRRKPNTLSLDVEMEEGRDPADKSADPERSALDCETRNIINAAIADLPEKYRSVMLLRHGRGMPLEEIAESLSLPLNTVKVHLFRAREQMKTRLEGVLEVGR